MIVERNEQCFYDENKKNVILTDVALHLLIRSYFRRKEHAFIRS